MICLKQSSFAPKSVLHKARCGGGFRERSGGGFRGGFRSGYLKGTPN